MRNKAYLRRVAALGCCVCGAEAVAHHIRTGTSSGMGLKASDEETIPLCQNHHTGAEGIHTIGIKTWQKRFGLEIEFLEETRAELKIVGNVGL